MRRNQDRFPVRRQQSWGLSPWSEGGLFPSEFFGGGGYPSAFSSSPWQIMQRMQEDMDRMFGQFFGGSGSAGTGLMPFQQATQQWSPSLDISQTDREWLIEVDLPGVNRDDIDVEVQNNYLILRAEMRQESQPQGQQAQQGQEGQQRQQGQQAPAVGQQGQQGQQTGQRQYYQRERRYGYIERILPLPENVDEDNINCEFRNGVLTLRLPKTQETRQQGRRIPIGEGATQQGQLSTGRGAGQTQAAGTGGRTSTRGAAEEEEEETAVAGAKGGATSRSADSSGQSRSSGGSRAQGGSSGSRKKS